MEWIKPPTDNLYKFIFVAGLLFAGWSLYEHSKAGEKANSLQEQYSKDRINLIVLRHIDPDGLQFMMHRWDDGVERLGAIKRQVGNVSSDFKQ